MVSYLSASGYALIVALRFDDDCTVAVASNEKSLFPVRGTLEVMN